MNSLMELTRYKIIYKIKKYELIQLDLLQKYLNKKENKFLLIGNLFFDSEIDIKNYSIIKNYINSITNYFFILYPHNNSEQIWYNFYTLLRAYRSPSKNIQEIIQEFQHLPNLETNKQYMKWIQFKVKAAMVDYYILQKLNYFPLLTELTETPQEIINLNY